MPRQSTALLCCLQHCTGVEAVGSVSVGVGRGWAGNMASRRLRVLLPSSLVEQPEDKPWRCKDGLHVVALHSRGRHPQPSFTRSLRRVVDVDAVDVWVVWVVHEEHPRAIDRALVKGAERMPRYAAVVLHSHAGAHPLVSSWGVCALSRLDALTPFSAHAAGPEVHDATRSSSSRPIFRSSACRSLMYLRAHIH